MRSTILALALLAGCSPTAPVSLVVTSPREVSYAPSASSHNGWTGALDGAIVVYVSSDSRDDNPTDPSEVRLSMTTKNGEQTGAMLYRDLVAGIKDCNVTADVGWIRPAPDFEIAFSAICEGQSVSGVVSQGR